MKINPHGSENSALQALIRQIRLVAFDFDGVFTDNMVYVFQDGSEAVKCYRGDGLGLQKLQRLGIETIIISTESNPVVSARARKLQVRCLQDCRDKLQTLENIARELGMALAEISFVGNDINDAACLASVGLPIVVQDAHRDVLPLALYRTSAPGGHGAVREVCDLFATILPAGGA
ncbi:MAG: HAD hydrolase family protein [Desulfobacterales bacterium]|nr:MAG: HAD hydrolase family protein [Desulfobacterales bacterium]